MGGGGRMKGQDKYSRMIDDLMILEPLESRYANQPKKAPPKAVSYTHLTLPTKRIV